MTAPRRMTCSRAHPHSRGEHLVTGGELAGHAGSSPLARGTWSRRCGCWWVIRLIPACAGNTTHPASSPSTSRAHPHSRGEHAQPFYNHVATFGSSPLAWGAQSERLFELNAVRLIPARAGNIHASNSTAHCRPAHPRLREERCMYSAQVGLSEGSSPLAWGTFHPSLQQPRRNGFIPDRAGNTHHD